MGFVELLLLAIGLSMDAFAVSVCKGLCMKRLNLRQATVVALFFGGFQALMPLVGWALGTQFEQFITPVDHWIAFVLLALIGGKMLWDAFHEDDEELSCPADGKLDLRELVMLAVATSIDALAVGITFAFLRVDILTSVGLIGVTTFALCRGPPLRRPLREARHRRRRHRPHPHRPQDPAGTPGDHSLLEAGRDVDSVFYLLRLAFLAELRTRSGAGLPPSEFRSEARTV